MTEKSQTLFEISWEICNKIGGIYTVINSKSNQINSKFKNYYQLGPLTENSKNYFQEKTLPKNLNQAKENLEKLGIKIHYGTSKENNKLKIILIDYSNYTHNINQIKTSLWEHYKIDSLLTNWYDFDEAILWSWTCGITIEQISNTAFKSEENILIHAHEWMSGGAIFYHEINKKNSNQQNQNKEQNNPNKFKTIFTTHATMLGRSLSSNNINLNECFNTIDPNEHAYKFGVATKQQTEKALANISNCFTTVSDITNIEASHFYSKTADILLYNGFNNEKIKNLENLNSKFYKSRKQTNKIIKEIFCKLPKINLDKTKLFFTSGRNEFKNKGFDLYIKSLNKLNQNLIEENSEINLINFFLVPIGNYEKLTLNKCDEIPLKTHKIHEHEILTELKNNNLNNMPNDKVFNILIPVYLDGNDGIINQKYYEFTTGFDLGVFVSYYEPWGYTPLEAISYAVPTITSDLAGFGLNILNNYQDFNPSVKILKRTQLSEKRQIEKLSEMLYDQVKANQKTQILQREFAKVTALKYDWSKFIKNYLKAYEIAINNSNKKQNNKTKNFKNIKT